MRFYLIVLLAVNSIFTANLRGADAWVDDHTLFSAVADYTISVDSIFEEIDLDIPDYYYASMDWGDVDNDGDLDLLISGALDIDGDTFADSSAIDIYINTEGDFSRFEQDNIYGLHLGAVRFVDIDLDEDLDLIVTGQNYENIFTFSMMVYINNGSEFTLAQSLDGHVYASLDLGDYDLDGDEDVLVSGAVQTDQGAGVATKIYENQLGTLVETSIDLPGVQNGDSQFSDFDKDGYLDILLMGLDNDWNYLLHYYKGSNDGFSIQQEMGGMYYGAFSIADYDNDGFLDFAIMGDNTDDNYAALLYHNDGNSFSQVQTLVGIDNSSGYSPIAWGDYNNDGWRDLVMSGTDEDYEDVTKLYQNDAGTLTIVDEGLWNLGGNAALGFADFDADNDLDVLLSGLYYDYETFDYFAYVIPHENTSSILNTAPEAPINTSATYDDLIQKLVFSWTAASDDTTPSEGLRYRLKVYDMSSSKLVSNYVVDGLSWALDIPLTDYSWSVRAIDAANVQSAPAEDDFIISSVKAAPNESLIEVYPNPVANKLYFKNFNGENLSVELYNYQGELVLRTDLVGKAMDVSNLASGSYHFILFDKNIQLSQGTFVKTN